MIDLLGDDFENYGEKTPDEVGGLLLQWAAEHEDANYHEYVAPFEALAVRVLDVTSPIQFVVVRSADLHATPTATFYINPGRTT